MSNADGKADEQELCMWCVMELNDDVELERHTDD